MSICSRNIVHLTIFYSFLSENKRCLHCRQFVHLTHCSEARGQQQHLLRGGLMSLTDGGVRLKSGRALSCDRTSDFQNKCSSANWDHSAHCVKASNRSRLFSQRRSERKYRWESGTKGKKQRRRHIQVWSSILLTGNKRYRTLTEWSQFVDDYFLSIIWHKVTKLRPFKTKRNGYIINNLSHSHFAPSPTQTFFSLESIVSALNSHKHAASQDIILLVVILQFSFLFEQVVLLDTKTGFRSFC